ncbi:hypothetical protein EJB05_33595, partial [Eragrostis curvula]
MEGGQAPRGRRLPAVPLLFLTLALNWTRSSSLSTFRLKLLSLPFFPAAQRCRAPPLLSVPGEVELLGSCGRKSPRCSWLTLPLSGIRCVDPAPFVPRQWPSGDHNLRQISSLWPYFVFPVRKLPSPPRSPVLPIPAELPLQVVDLQAGEHPTGLD